MFFSILFPSLCTFCLGTLLESVEVSDSPVGELNIAYCIESNDHSAGALETFLLSLDEGSIINAEKIPASELESATEKYSAAIALNGAEITIYNGSNAVRNRTVKALIDGYEQAAGAYMSVAETDPLLFANIDTSSNDEYVQPKDFGRTRTMMDYYAVAMTVVIVFFGSCIAGASVYTDEHNANTILRLNTAPVSKTVIYFGKILGHLPLVLIQVATVMIVSTLFFGAHFCSTLGENLLLCAMFVCTSMALLAFGVLINLFFPKIPSMPVLMPIIWVMLFFSGVFQMDLLIDGVSEHLPSWIVLNAAFDLTVFSRTDKAVSVLLWSFGIFAALIVIGWLKVNARRKNA